MEIDFFPRRADVRQLAAPIPPDLLPDGFENGNSGEILYDGSIYLIAVSQNGILCAYKPSSTAQDRPAVVVVPRTDGRRDIHFADETTQAALVARYYVPPDPTLDPQNLRHFWAAAPSWMQPAP